VRRPDAEDLAAERLDVVVLEPEDRRHRARALPGRLGHRETALADEADRLAGAERADGRERRELADRMPDHNVRLDALLADGREDREARRNERRLLDFRLDELVEWRLEAEV